MMITPLPHYDKFVHKSFQVGGGGGGGGEMSRPTDPTKRPFKNVDWLPNSVLLLHQRLMVKIKCQWTS